MKNKLIIKECKSCNAMVKVLKDCNCKNCGIKCCGDIMSEVISNSTDASTERHIPTYQKVEDEIFVRVDHPMEKEHYIEWISLVNENQETTVTLYPEQNAEIRFRYIPGSTIYVYCNKHGLWNTEVK
ncbi:MAG: desulfoferrodoxin family protein [Clostridia bacterium]|nr:desulfoferrodoxin family protein [Clostridia bacterium]